MWWKFICIETIQLVLSHICLDKLHIPEQIHIYEQNDMNVFEVSLFLWVPVYCHCCFSPWFWIWVCCSSCSRRKTWWCPAEATSSDTGLWRLQVNKAAGSCYRAQVSQQSQNFPMSIPERLLHPIVYYVLTFASSFAFKLHSPKARTHGHTHLPHQLHNSLSERRLCCYHQ